MDNYNKLIDKIKNRTAKTAIVGLPQALYHAQAGYDVTGIERMPHRVADINQRRSYLVYDTRNALKGNTSQNIYRLGGPKIAAARVK